MSGRQTLRRRLRALRRDERGAAIIEMAAVMPVLALVLVGITDLARGYTAKLQLEQAAYRTLEMAVLARNVSDWAFLKAEAASAAGVPTSEVTLEAWLECKGVKQASYTGTCPTGETSARYVSLTIDGSYQPLFTAGPYATKNGVVPIEASAAVRVQ